MTNKNDKSMRGPLSDDPRNPNQSKAELPNVREIEADELQDNPKTKLSDASRPELPNPRE